MWRPGVLRDEGRSAVLAVPANDIIRPLSTVEVALKVRPCGRAGEAGRYALDPQYGRWMAANFPRAVFHLAPLADYDQRVRPADARVTLEELAAELGAKAERDGGYALAPAGGWWASTAMFAVGCSSPRALVDFLFAWG